MILKTLIVFKTEFLRILIIILKIQVLITMTNYLKQKIKTYLIKILQKKNN